MTADVRPDGRLPEILEELVPGPRSRLSRRGRRGRRRERSAPRGPSQEGGSPWPTSPAGPRSPRRSRGARSGSRSSSSPSSWPPPSRSRLAAGPVPAPFGLARNGVIAYADGDIYTADPATGITTAIVTGTQEDVDPVFSPDGTRLAYGRFVEGSSPPRMDIVVADADGTHPQVITTEPIPVDEVRFEWRRIPGH